MFPMPCDRSLYTFTRFGLDFSLDGDLVLDDTFLTADSLSPESERPHRSGFVSPIPLHLPSRGVS